MSEDTALVQTASKRLLETYKAKRIYVDKILPDSLRGERFAYLVADQVTRNPALAGTTPASFLRSVMAAASLGLEIRSNSCYLVPFGAECQLMIDYRGKMDLARRSGRVGNITPVLVREADEFDWWIDDTGFHLAYRQSKAEDRGEIVAGFAFAELTGQAKPQFLPPMTIADIEARRKRSKKGVGELSLAEIRKLDAINLGFRDQKRTPWTTDYDRMAIKTVVHDLCRWLPQTPELTYSDAVDAALDVGGKVPSMEGKLTVEFDNEDETPMIEPKTPEEMKAYAEQRQVEVAKPRKL